MACLLQVELLYSCLIGSDGSTLHTDRVLQNGLRSLLSNLVIGLITVL